MTTNIDLTEAERKQVIDMLSDTTSRQFFDEAGRNYNRFLDTNDSSYKIAYHAFRLAGQMLLKTKELLERGDIKL